MGGFILVRPKKTNNVSFRRTSAAITRLTMDDERVDVFVPGQGHTLQCLLRHAFTHVPAEDPRSCRSAVVVAGHNGSQEGVRIRGLTLRELECVLDTLTQHLTICKAAPIR
jgi:hypothetical protein